MMCVGYVPVVGGKRELPFTIGIILEGGGGYIWVPMLLI